MLKNLSYDNVLEMILQWPLEQQQHLIQAVSRQMVTNHSPKASVAMAELESIWAMFPADMPDYTEAQLDEMKIQWRMEKYGESTT